MKFEIHFLELKKTISLIERVAGKHMTLPVLSCILFELKKNSLILRATNLDVGVEITLSAKSNNTGTVAVPASILSQFLNQISDYDGVINMELISGSIKINTNTSQGIIKTIPHDDFPTIPDVSDAPGISLLPEIVVKGLRSVSYSASLSSVKPELSSVYMYSANDSIIFAATDSFRLAEKKIAVPVKVAIKDILIPFKNINDIVRILESIKTPLVIRVGKNLLSIEAPNTMRIVSRIVTGVFPDYQQIIPKGHTTEVIVLKQDLLNALKISNIFSDKFNQVHFTIDPKEKLFEIQTKNSDVGENKTNINSTVSGERVEINFNHKYIVDCFQSIDADSMSLKLSGTNRPMVINPISPDKSFTYLVMPMNR